MEGRLVYIFLGNIVATILGILVLAITLIANVGLASIGWGLLTYVVFLIVSIILAITDPFKFDN